MNKANIAEKQSLVSLKRENGREFFEVTVSLPLETGFYEDVYLHVYGHAEPLKIEHHENDAEYAIFKATVSLEENSVYYYWFSLKVDGEERIMKEKQLSGRRNITREECFCISYLTYWEKLSKHQITSISKDADSETFKVVVQLPTEHGYYDNVRLAYCKYECLFKEVLNGFWEEDWKYETLDFIGEEGDYYLYEKEIQFPTHALYYYYVSFTCEWIHAAYKKVTINPATVIEAEECFKLSANCDCPDWAKSAILGQVLLDRFCRDESVKVLMPSECNGYMADRTINKWGDPPVLGANEKGLWCMDYYLGNFKGACSGKAMQLYKDLNLDALYAMPVQKGQANHGYNTTDFSKIEPYLGTDEDAQEFCQKLHKVNMHIIVDIVFNHAGDRSPYFDRMNESGEIGAYKAITEGKDSKFKTFFKTKWENGKLVFDYWFGITDTPLINTDSPEFKLYILGESGVLRYLKSLGFDSFRVDLYEEMSPDFCSKMFEVILEDNIDGFVLVELWQHYMHKKRQEIYNGKGAHAPMNYWYMDAIIRWYLWNDCQTLYWRTKDINVEYPDYVIASMVNHTSTHDMSRSIELYAKLPYFYPDWEKHEWSWTLDFPSDSDIVRNHKLTKEQYEAAKRREKSAFIALAFSFGSFCINLGDEVGQPGLHNIANRGCYPWNNRDMDLFEYCKQFLTVRHDSEMLRKAGHKIVWLDENIYMFERIYGDKKMLIAVSNTEESREIQIPEEFKNCKTLFKTNPEDTAERLGSFGTIVLAN